MGDNPAGTHKKRIAGEMETCIGLLSSIENHAHSSQRTLAGS
jgi:hypothetical protein